MKQSLKNKGRSKPCAVTINGVTDKYESVKAACNALGIEYVNITRKLKSGKCRVTTKKGTVIELEVLHG